MRRLLVAAALVLACTSAFALPTVVKKGLKPGTDCLGPVSTMAPKLATCAIAGTKTRIWCPNGDKFDTDEEKSPVPLIRSLCTLTQLPRAKRAAPAAVMRPPAAPYPARDA